MKRFFKIFYCLMLGVICFIISIALNNSIQLYSSETTSESYNKNNIIYNKVPSFKDINLNIINGYINDSNNLYYKDNNIVIYGNYDRLESREFLEFNNALEQGKIIIIYDVINQINTSFQQDELKNTIQATIYSYINGYKHRRTLTSNQIDKKILIDDIHQFVLDFINEKKLEQLSINLNNKVDVLDQVANDYKNNSNFNNLDVSRFKKVWQDDSYKDDYDNLYGFSRLVWSTNVHKSEDFTLETDLYIQETHAKFIPAEALCNNDVSQYCTKILPILGNYKGEFGYLATSIKQYSNSNNGKIFSGSQPNINDYWPVYQSDNSPIKRLDNYSYSKTNINEEVGFSAQTLINQEKYSWTFDYEKWSKGTYHLYAGVLFELPHDDDFNGYYTMKQEMSFTTRRLFSLYHQTTLSEERNINGY